MFEKSQKLDVTQDEIAVIEAALATQAKILSVQADAGGSGARRRLNEVKKVLSHIEHQRPNQEPAKARSWFGFLGFARTAS